MKKQKAKLIFLKINKYLKYLVLGSISLFVLFSLFFEEKSNLKEIKTRNFINSFKAKHYATLEKKQLRTDNLNSEYFIFKTGNNSSGYIFFSEKFTPEIEGYNAPLNLIIALDINGKLMNFDVIEHSETPSYFNKAIRIRNNLIGVNVLKKTSESVDSITGATITSDAIKKIVYASSYKFMTGSNIAQEAQTIPITETSNFKPTWAIYLFLATLIAVIFLRKKFRKKYPRLARLGYIFIVFGFIFNFQYSSGEVLSLLKGNFLISIFSRSFIMVILIPISVFLFFNLYCGFLCPFGALQEFAASLNRRSSIKCFPGQQIWTISSSLKYFILLLIILGLYPIFSSLDILQSAFAGNYTGIMLTALIWFIFCSMIFPRFWCRIFCPTGAFFSLIRLISPFRIMNKKVIPAKCTSGIVSGKESDCLCCDRCMVKKTQKLKMNRKFIFNRNSIIFILALMISVFILTLLVLSSSVKEKAGIDELPIKELKLPPSPTLKDARLL